MTLESREFATDSAQDILARLERYAAARRAASRGPIGDLRPVVPAAREARPPFEREDDREEVTRRLVATHRTRCTGRSEAFLVGIDANEIDDGMRLVDRVGDQRLQVDWCAQEHQRARERPRRRRERSERLSAA